MITANKSNKKYTARRQNYKVVSLSLLVVLCLGIVFFTSCDKTPVGYGELDRDVSGAVFNEFRSANRYCYGKYIPLGTADYMVLGTNAEYESRILMQFQLEDTTINLDSVTAVKLVLYPKRFKNIGFTVHPVVRASEWRESNTTWIRMDEAVPWLTNGGDYYPTVLAHSTLTSDSCVIEFNRSKLDTLVNHSYGIIIVPDTTLQDFATIYSRAVSSKSPKLILEFGDTPDVFLPIQDCHIIDTLNLSLPPLDLWLGAGFPFRTMLKFNIDTIPANVTIAYAELILPVESNYSVSDTVNIGIWKILETNYTSLTRYQDNISAASQYINSADTVIIFDIRKIVQYWNVKPDSNFGVLISLYPENYEISRIKLKTGTSAPRLKVGYILPPKGRF